MQLPQEVSHLQRPHLPWITTNHGCWQLPGNLCRDKCPWMLNESPISREEALRNVPDASRFLTKVWGPGSCYWETPQHAQCLPPLNFRTTLSPKETSSLLLFLGCLNSTQPSKFALLSFTLLHPPSLPHFFPAQRLLLTFLSTVPGKLQPGRPAFSRVRTSFP